jgi:hypothetical protein
VGPTCQRRVRGERGSGLAVLGGPVAGPRGKKKIKGGLGCKGEMGEGDLFCFFFNSFYFLFKLLLKTFSKFLNKLLTTQSIQNHAFNMMHKHLISLN